jgi:hypothetical protein
MNRGPFLSVVEADRELVRQREFVKEIAAIP